MDPHPLITPWRDDAGRGHLRVDAPGERAVSAPLPGGDDALQLLGLIAAAADLEVKEEGNSGAIRVSVPPGS